MDFSLFAKEKAEGLLSLLRGWERVKPWRFVSVNWKRDSGRKFQIGMAKGFFQKSFLCKT